MVNEKFREILAETYDGEEIKILDNPAYDNSIIGMTEDCRLVYDYSKMIEEISEDNDISEEEAVDFVDYNTMRALSYFGDGAPIVIFTDDIEDIKSLAGTL